MKNYFLIAVSGLFMVACNNAGETESTAIDSLNNATDTTFNDSNGNATHLNNKPADTATISNSNATSNEFVSKAVAGGMMEVEMGKLAQSNGASDGVKNYGKMLEKDHGAANDKLKDIAGRENIAVPAAISPEQRQHIDKMQALRGKDFDKAFIPMMIEDHKKEIAEFKKAADANENASIKAFAKSTLPTLETHLSKVKSLKAKMKS